MEKDKYLLVFPIARIKHKLKIKAAESKLCMSDLIFISLYKSYPDIFKCIDSPSGEKDAIELKVCDTGVMEII